MRKLLVKLFIVIVLCLELFHADTFAADSGAGLEVFPSSRNVSIGILTNNAKLTLNGDFALRETTTQTATANYGEVYVSSSDSELYFDADDQSPVKITSNGSLATSGGGGGSATPGGSTGAVQFNVSSTFTGDTPNFNWDDTNNRLGLLTSTPDVTLHNNGTTAFGSGYYETSNANGIPAAAITRTVLRLAGPCEGVNVDWTRSPQIDAGTDGQLLILVGSFDNSTVKVDHNAGLAP